MSKYVSVALLVALLTLGGFFLFEKHKNSELSKKYNNAMVEMEGVKQETETAKSIRALLEEKLEAQDKELQGIISDRNEKILAQTEINIQLKDRLLKAENARQSVVTKDGTTITISETKECDENIRHKVEFDITEKPLRVVGFTLTNPAYAEVNLQWVENIKLELNLTRDDDGNFRVYSDSDELKVADITLKVDPEVLETKWYEKFSFGADIAAGKYGAQFGLRPGYDVLESLNVNLLFVVQYDGKAAKTFYGAGVNWHPWK